MRRFRLGLVLLVITIVLTGGCLGLEGGDSENGVDDTTSQNGDDTGASNGDDTDASNGDDSADSNGDETADADGNGADPSGEDSSDDPAGEDDPSDLVDDGGPGDPVDENDPTSGADRWTVTDPEEPLNEAGSYTNTWTWRSTFEETDGEELSSTTLVDADAARASSTIGMDGEVIETFYADGKQYTRIGSADGADESFVVDAAFDDVELNLDYGYGFETGDLSEWTSQGTETYDGVTVQRYTYEGPDYWTELEQEPESEAFSLQASTLELLVDDDGIARYQSYRVEGVDGTGAEGRYEWEYTLTDIGTTTVADPPWLDEAIPLDY